MNFKIISRVLIFSFIFFITREIIIILFAKIISYKIRNTGSSKKRDIVS